MPSRPVVSPALLGAPGLAFATGFTRAQSMKPGDVCAAASITAVSTLDTGLDQFGENRFVPSFARITLAHRC